MSKILVKASINYGDEFDCEAFKVYDSIGEWEAYVKGVTERIKVSNGCLERCFGSNEVLCFYDISDLTSNCTITEVTDEQAYFLDKVLVGFGVGYSAIFKIGY